MTDHTISPPRSSPLFSFFFFFSSPPLPLSAFSSPPQKTPPPRIFDKTRNHQDSKNSDGNVDVEGPSPGVLIREPATESWAEDGSDDDAESKDGHRGAALLRRKTFQEDGLRNWLQSAAARSLNGARDQNPTKTRGGAAEERRDRENYDADEQKILAAEPLGEPAAGRKNHRVGDQIAGQHPRGFASGGGKAAGYVRQSDRSDGSVQDFHEGSQHYSGSNQPRADAGLPILARGAVV